MIDLLRAYEKCLQFRCAKLYGPWFLIKAQAKKHEVSETTISKEQHWLTFMENHLVGHLCVSNYRRLVELFSPSGCQRHMELSVLFDFIADAAQFGSQNAILAIGVAYNDGLVGNRIARKLATEG